MNEPASIMLGATQDVLADVARELRKRGWPCELRVDVVAVRNTYAVSLVIELPPRLAPIKTEPMSDPTTELARARGDAT